MALNSYGFDKYQAYAKELFHYCPAKSAQA